MSEWSWQKHFAAGSSLFTEAWPEVDMDFLAGASAVRSIPVTLGSKKRLDLEIRTAWSDDELRVTVLNEAAPTIGKLFGEGAEVDVYIVRNKLGEPRLINLVPKMAAV